MIQRAVSFVSGASIRTRFLVVAAATALGFAAIAALFTNERAGLDRSAEAARANAVLAIDAERIVALGLQLRLSERSLIETGESGYASTMNTVIGELADRLGDLATRGTSPDFAKGAEEAVTGLTAYGSALKELSARLERLEAERRDARTAIVGLANAATTTGREIDAGTANDVADLLKLRSEQGWSRVERQVNGLRDAVERVLRNDGRAGAAERQAQMLARVVAEIGAFNPEQRERFTRAGAALVAATVAVAGTRDAIDDDVNALGAAFTRVREGSRSMVESASAEMKAASDSVGARLDAVGNGITIAILATLLLVGALAILIGGATTALVRRLTRAMGRVAAGDTESEVPYATRKDDIGDMARALEVFRGNARALAAAETEREARSAESRAARRRMVAELEQAIGSVASAAADGDFSRRVEARFDDPGLTAIGESLNKLVGRVDTGLSDTCRVLAALGGGDLTARVTGDAGGAFGELRDGVNAMAENLAAVLGRVVDAVAALDGAAAEILAGADQLAGRTTEAASTLEETSAAVDAFATTVSGTAERARDAARRAGEARAKADDGGLVMGDTRAAMQRIDTSSARIGEVIGLIDDIAFQTNLLALNASVEAARAGEAGRGFAVVAGEVRRLAQRAAEASREVKSLVQAAQGEVRGGVALVERASGALAAIVSAITEVSHIVGDIAEASAGQATSVGEISIAMRRMDEMTQANAALVEETNGAVAATRVQVDGLGDTVAGFRMGAMGATRRAA
jgi:methyl-accepting chemotaxis protein